MDTVWIRGSIFARGLQNVRTYLLNVSDPVSDVIERLLTGDIIHQHDPLGNDNRINTQIQMCCHQHDHLGNGKHYKHSDTDMRCIVMDTENAVVWHNLLVPALIETTLSLTHTHTHNKEEVRGYHGAAVVGGRDGPEPLLASGIPGNRQINNLTGDCIIFTQKIHNTLRLVSLHIHSTYLWTKYRDTA